MLSKAVLTYATNTRQNEDKRHISLNPLQFTVNYITLSSHDINVCFRCYHLASYGDQRYMDDYKV